jgi:branched-subunit amino acid aminotransferase/4-amino-4-deoxychorismate lyase
MPLLALAVSGMGLVDADAPVLFADDGGFLRGRAAFETVRVYAGVPFLLDQHFERLEESAAQLGLARGARREIAPLISAVMEACEDRDAMLRVFWTPGREGGEEPIGLALLSDVPAEYEEMRKQGIAAWTVCTRVEAPQYLSGVKSTSYAASFKALDEARSRGAQEAILISSDETVLECPTANIWWRHGNTLHTPTTAVGVLAGVTRAILLSTARSSGYSVAEGTYSLNDLLQGEELFTTSSVREVMPVVSLNGQKVDTGQPGPAAQRLQTLLRSLA